MRIIGGTLKGKAILPPRGYKARPTTDFAREGLFNVLDNVYDFEGLKVLDLFGGTGAIAFEFASRGASRVWCVEMARENASFIKTEAARLGLGYDLNAATTEPDGAGIKLTLPLDGGFALVKTITADGSRFTVRVIQP